MSSTEFIDDILSRFKNTLQEETKSKNMKILREWFDTEEGKKTYSNLEKALRKLLEKDDSELNKTYLEELFGWEEI